MRTAAARDRIARQYASGYADVLELGVPRLEQCRARGWPEPWAVTSTYLAFLAAFPDSHILRKHGPAMAEEVRAAAVGLDAALLAADDPASLHETLLEADRRLKAAGLNPGTSADLTVASHLATGLGIDARTIGDRSITER
jgi:triphosphoribosyl-dephospho-CoA synthase